MKPTKAEDSNTDSLDPAEEASLRAACDWLIDVAQVRGRQAEGVETRGMVYDDWRGAIRGEYDAGTQSWRFFCPIWHTGQAVKALVLAYRVLREERLLEAAEFSAGFLLRSRIDDPADPNHGMLLAYEDVPDGVNTSAILESLEGLFALHDETGCERCGKAALEALDWVARKAYCPGEGLFEDVYQWREDRFVVHNKRFAGCDVRRPLLDNAVFLQAFARTGGERYRTIFYEVAERLLADENPPGNWIAYHPCKKEAGTIHPRHAFWWGMPMLDAWRDCGEERFLECARRAARWYVAALRRDGGLIRETDTEFNTASFGHCTSAAACAVLFFHRMIREAGDREFEAPMEKALRFCRSMQLTDTRDPNLRGVILEKVLPPRGSDRSPYYIRDLGCIFYIQALLAAKAPR